MLNRRTIWLLAAVMALGTACVVPTARVERRAEAYAIVCRAGHHCEQQQMGGKPQGSQEASPDPVPFNYRPPQAPRYQWPANYQRPPTRSL
jgi:hypothetical protein